MCERERTQLTRNFSSRLTFTLILISVNESKKANQLVCFFYLPPDANFILHSILIDQLTTGATLWESLIKKVATPTLEIHNAYPT